MNEKTYEEVLAENNSFCWRVKGVSMLPLIRQGRDVFTVTRFQKGQLKKYDVVLFKRPGVQGKDAYVLHRILRIGNDGTYWIAGDNCIGGETVREENILAVMTSVKRKGKMIQVSDFGYKLYVYLWCAPYPVRFFLLKHKGVLRRCAGKILRKLHLRQ